MTETPAIALAKWLDPERPSGWRYERVECPACAGTGLIPDVPLGPVKCQFCLDHPPYQDEYEVPCGLCHGDGELFVDGEYDATQARILGLYRSPNPADREAADEEVLQMTIKWAEGPEEPIIPDSELPPPPAEGELPF